MLPNLTDSVAAVVAKSIDTFSASLIDCAKCLAF